MVTGTGTSAATDGTDTLYAVERLQFSNGTFSLAQLGLDDFDADATTTGVLALNGSVVANLGFRA